MTLDVDITSLPPEVRADLTDWLTMLAKRAVAGNAEYGERSQHRPEHELVGEQIEEICDVQGWTFPQFQRLRAKQRKLMGDR